MASILGSMLGTGGSAIVNPVSTLMTTLTGGNSGILGITPFGLAMKATFGENWEWYVLIAAAVGGTIFLLLLIK